ncbi:hypothetical protein [Streptomyces sp. NPDC046261]|uniref:hypothetical protein n=1 Tax=Streptomyces sp. NPDC046261 TaxID=3157200 RepID=UPI0033CF192F
MAHIAGRTGHRAHGGRGADVFGERRAAVPSTPASPAPPSPPSRASTTRHPLVAAAMVLPLAAFLAVVFGGWDAVVLQASSVAGMLGR